MSKDLLLGFLIAIPLYAIVLYLFKDIIVGRFIRKLLENASTETISTPFKTADFKIAVENDLMTSYKLLLVIQDEISFLKTTPENEIMSAVFDDRLKELDYTLSRTEDLFEEMGNTEYKDIKKNWVTMLKKRNLF